jgi:hypothetical protein
VEISFPPLLRSISLTARHYLAQLFCILFPLVDSFGNNLTLSNLGSGGISLSAQIYSQIVKPGLLWTSRMSEHWDEGNTVSILFEGSKYFGTTQTLFHIALIEHAHQDTIEIVSYNKRHAVEAPRLYLTYSAVLSRIDASEVNERVQSLREEATARQIAVDDKKFIKIATGEILFDFVSSRLFSVAISGQKVKLEFKLLHKDPKSASAPNPLCSRPEHVEPFSFDSVSVRYATAQVC